MNTPDRGDLRQAILGGTLTPAQAAAVAAIVDDALGMADIEDQANPERRNDTWQAARWRALHKRVVANRGALEIEKPLTLW